MRSRCDNCLGYLLRGGEPWIPVVGLRMVDGVNMAAYLACPSVLYVRMAFTVVVASLISGVDLAVMAPLGVLV